MAVAVSQKCGKKITGLTEMTPLHSELNIGKSEEIKQQNEQ